MAILAKLAISLLNVAILATLARYFVQFGYFGYFGYFSFVQMYLTQYYFPSQNFGGKWITPIKYGISGFVNSTILPVAISAKKCYRRSDIGN